MKKLIIIIIVILTAIAIYSGLQYKAQKDVEQEKSLKNEKSFTNHNKNVLNSILFITQKIKVK